MGSCQNMWKSEKHCTLREVATRKVKKFNTSISGSDYLLTLSPQSDGASLMDQPGEIFDSMTGEMTRNMFDNDLLPTSTTTNR